MPLTYNIKSKVGNLVISLQPYIIGCNDLRGFKDKMMVSYHLEGSTTERTPKIMLSFRVIRP